MKKIGVYKIICAAFAAVLASSAVIAEELKIVGTGTYSEGWRLGGAPKFSIKGAIISSGEGTMMVGNNSSVLEERDTEGNVKVINPWAFSSADSRMQKKINNWVSPFAVIKYHQARLKSVKVDTEYEVVDIFEIDKSLSLTETCSTENYVKGVKSNGRRPGRIVKASAKGTLSKSWEVTIQEGNAGNKFVHMSISEDEEMFKCAVRSLRAGQYVIVGYSESLVNTGKLTGDSDTAYDIRSITPADVGM